MKRDQCQDCNREYAPWFVSSGLWLKVVGMHQGMLCPSCFLLRAQMVMGEVREWFLTPLLGNGRLPDDPEPIIRYEEMERLSERIRELEPSHH